MLEGEGAIYAPGAKSRDSLVIQVTDETGRPVDGAAVSFRLPEEGPGAVFARTMKTEIATTTPEGRAAAFGLEYNRIPGQFQIRVTAIKGDLRAGTIVAQYISDKAQTVTANRIVSVKSSSPKKWILLGLLAGSAAAITVLVPKGSTKPGPVATVPQPPQIGSPTIAIGKP